MTTSEVQTTRRGKGWAGIVFVVLYVVGLLMLGGAAPDNADKKPFKDNPVKLSALWRAYYNDSGHRWMIIIAVYIVLAATIAFVVFGNDLRERLEASGARTTAVLVLAGAIIFAVATAIGALALGWIPGSKQLGGAPVPHGELNYLSSQLGYGILLVPGGGAIALTLIAGGFGGARSRALPVWLGWAGVVIGVVLFFIAGIFVPLILFVLWVLIVSIVMLRRPDATPVAPPM